ncbi:MAG: right-handed parallel beta-helix repeat-containing protein [Planctomycetota bacterium]
MQTRNPIVLRLNALGPVLVWAVSVQAATIYVDKDATGSTHDGSSWCNAYLTVQDALVAPSPSTTIRVADGIYNPDRGGGKTPGDRSATFQLKNGVTLQGGYAGCGAPDPNARNIITNETILSGDLNGDDAPVTCTQSSPDCDSFGSLCVDGFCILADNNAENSYHVLTGSGMNPTAVIDGFTIAAGNGSAFFPNERGGGMYNNGGSPTVTNCTFRGNSTSDEFGKGGGMYNGNSSPTVTNCTFSENSAWLGGGMFNWGSSNPTVTNCTFSANSARDGGGMNSQPGSNPTLTDCTFNGNSAGVGGAGIINWDSATVTNCTFSGNSAGGIGGGMGNSGSGNLAVTNCKFSGNSATFHGGGMENFSSNPVVTNCTFDRNLAGEVGGGMTNFRSSPTVTNCPFHGNSAGSHGGGIFNAGSSPTVTNGTFSGNSSGAHGGGIHNVDSSSPTVTNCTLSGNSATGNGGGIYNQNDSNVTVINSIFWSNSDVSGIGGSSQIHTYSGTPVVNYSIVQGGWSGAGGVGVLDTDPLFLDADGPDDIPGTEDDDLRLMPGSPAIDAADTTALPLDVADLDDDGDTTERTPRDLAGGPRVVDDPATADTGVPGSGVVDMGAYEFQPDCNANGISDASDIASGTSADCNANGVPDECEELPCPPVLGACCDHDPFGGCTDGLTRAECDCARCEWSKLALCEDVQCPRDSIPTVGGWGLAILALLLITGAKVRFGRLQQT